MNARAVAIPTLSTRRFIHRLILTRLFLGWLLLSLVIGGVVLWLEVNRIQQFVHELALKESANFSGESAHNLQGLDAKARQHLEKLAEKLVNQHFLVVELYDLNKQLQLETVRPGLELVERDINRFRHQFPQQGAFSHQFHLLRGEWLLVILVPLSDPQNSLCGYFEGIYQVDRDTLNSIKTGLLRKLLFAALGITFTALLIYPIILMLNRELIRLSADLLKGNLQLMNVLGCAIAERDSDTNSHNYRVTFYALRLGEAIGLPRAKLRDLITGAFLHDVGKIGIRDLILLKPGKLSPAEFEVMKSHVALGVDIINKSSWLKGARDIVECHHEKFDGSGYVKGLTGEAIPLNARIFAIVDVFDALTSSRPYKEPWPVSDAIATLEQESGKHFDPRLVSVFTPMARRLYDEISRIDEQRMEVMLHHLIAPYFLNTGVERSS
ncbi:phosphohydrolase [Methylomonas lenta]|jgi:HD-GYP domain-containing protein (c-di-GMP phosphodiesterase class II)|uniref:Phosphohydrolase n=1 Tax=Methylomonas lenta TaxID=980561 RepID=A0A177MYH8_9GAMM|nr:MULTISPECIES: HD-GYP domain-containing protein [Methylomonas]MCK9607989.1 HD-GYP domain-containing protein [Methylomonas sp.]OAI10702.1 phosphohydrolase [Methylomonas lenta]